MSHHEHSSRHYEREAEATRQRLAERLDDLNEHLTFGRVMDEVLGYAKGGGGSFLRAFTNAARENPVPSLLVSTGAMLFLSERLGLTGTKPAQRASRTPSSFPGVTRAGASMQSAIERRAQNVAESLSSAAEGVSSAARSARDHAASAAGAVSDTVGEYSQRIGDQASEMAEQAQEQLGAASEEVIRRIRKLIEEQPLLVGAIGLAIGAGIAAVVPTTEAEKEYLGESREAAKEAISEFASEQLETAKDAAEKVAQAMSKAADAEGLTEEVQSFGDSVSKRLGKVAQAGADRARESLQSGKKT